MLPLSTKLFGGPTKDPRSQHLSRRERGLCILWWQAGLLAALQTLRPSAGWTSAGHPAAAAQSQEAEVVNQGWSAELPAAETYQRGRKAEIGAGSGLCGQNHQEPNYQCRRQQQNLRPRPSDPGGQSTLRVERTASVSSRRGREPERNTGRG